jgi:hypothetical protein
VNRNLVTILLVPLLRDEQLEVFYNSNIVNSLLYNPLSKGVILLNHIEQKLSTNPELEDICIVSDVGLYKRSVFNEPNSKVGDYLIQLYLDSFYYVDYNKIINSTYSKVCDRAAYRIVDFPANAKYKKSLEIILRPAGLYRKQKAEYLQVEEELLVELGDRFDTESFIAPQSYLNLYTKLNSEYAINRTRNTKIS